MSAPILNQFIGRVHRRLVVLRIVESAGIALAVGAVAACLLLGLRHFQGSGASFSIIGILPVAVVIGVIFGIIRRPRALDAAIEADRQLNLADLLSTAWSLRNGDLALSAEQSGFSAAVLSMAEDRCAVLAPSSVLLNRLGARAWGGIGLSTALALSIVVLSANPVETQASVNPRPVSRAAATRPDSNSTNLGTVASSGSNRLLSPDAVRAADDEPGSAQPGRQTQVHENAGGGDNQNNSAEPNGRGTGVSQTRTPGSDGSINPGDATQARGSDESGTAASGVGAPSTDGGGNGENPTAVAGTAPPSHSGEAVIPALSPRENAAEAVRSGQVPAAYHELVRMYFER